LPDGLRSALYLLFRLIGIALLTALFLTPGFVVDWRIQTRSFPFPPFASVLHKSGNGGLLGGASLPRMLLCNTRAHCSGAARVTRVRRITHSERRAVVTRLPTPDE